LEVRELVVFPTDGGGFPALDGLDLAVAWGETTAVVAEPGGGKSLLARALFGLAPIADGSVRLDGQELVGTSGRERHSWLRRMQLVLPAEPMAMDPLWPVRRVVAEPLTAMGLGGGRGVRRGVAEVLAECGVPIDRSGSLPGDLTLLQRQRVALARALSMHPDLVVLDEPLAGLDLTGQTQFVELLTRLQVRMGVAFLFLCGDIAAARAVAAQTAVLCGGRVVESGPSIQVCGRPRHPFTRALVDAQLPYRPGTWADRNRFRPVDRPLRPRARSAGCVFLDRCPLGDDICAARSPRIRERESGHWAACHHAEQIPDREAEPVSD